MDSGRLPGEESHAGLSPLLYIHGHDQVSFLPIAQWAFQSSVSYSLFWGFHPHGICTPKSVHIAPG